MVESSGAMAPGRCYDQEDIESPAYSLGGHETAGFCAVVFGRQPGKAGLLNRSEWDNINSGDGVNTPCGIIFATEFAAAGGRKSAINGRIADFLCRRHTDGERCWRPLNSLRAWRVGEVRAWRVGTDCGRGGC